MFRRHVIATLFCATVAAASGPALSHSELRSSFPVDGQRLPTSPGRLELVFNERVQITALRLIHQSGYEQPFARPRAVERITSHQTILPAMEAGDWRIEWRIISADGHPVSGVIRFRIGQP